MVDNADIAKSVIDGLVNYNEFITSLSVAICGGIVAFYSFLIFENNNQNIKIRTPWLLFLSFFVMAGSVLFSYLSASSIIASIPALFYLQYPDESLTKTIKNSGIHTLIYLPFLQFLLFYTGLFILGIFLYRNRSLVIHQEET